MRNDQISVKINCMYRLPIVVAIESSKTGFKDELFNWLNKCVMDGMNDEVLYAIAIQLGGESVFKCLQSRALDLLESLAYEDETVVREAAVNSIISVSRFVNENEIPGLALRLSEKPVFQAKVSAIHVISSTISKAGAHKGSMLDKLIKLSEDETPMIRRAIANILGDLIDVLDIKEYGIKFMGILELYCNDDQESVKILCMDALIKVVHKLISSPELKNMEEYSRLKTLLIGQSISFSSDKAWKVRLNYSKKLPEFCGMACPDDSLEKSLFSNYVGLLSDSETDVKIAAINSLANYLKPFVGKVIRNENINAEVVKLNPGIKKLRMVIEKISTIDNILADIVNGQSLVKIAIMEFVMAYANLTTENMLKEKDNAKITLLLKSFLKQITQYFRNLDNSQVNQIDVETIMHMLDAYYKCLIKVDAAERVQLIETDLEANVKTAEKYKSWRIDARILEAYSTIACSLQSAKPNAA